MNGMKISPEAQQTLIELQTFQQQMQTVILQKESLSIQNMEIEKALEELEKTEHDEVFKTVGPVLIKSTRKALTEELKEKQETIDVRLKSLQKQEDRIKEKLKESQEKFQKLMTAEESESVAV